MTTVSKMIYHPSYHQISVLIVGVYGLSSLKFLKLSCSILRPLVKTHNIKVENNSHLVVGYLTLHVAAFIQA